MTLDLFSKSGLAALAAVITTTAAATWAVRDAVAEDTRAALEACTGLQGPELAGLVETIRATAVDADANIKYESLSVVHDRMTLDLDVCKAEGRTQAASCESGVARAAELASTERAALEEQVRLLMRNYANGESLTLRVGQARALAGGRYVVGLERVGEESPLVGIAINGQYESLAIGDKSTIGEGPVRFEIFATDINAKNQSAALTIVKITDTVDPR